MSGESRSAEGGSGRVTCWRSRSAGRSGAVRSGKKGSGCAGSGRERPGTVRSACSNGGSEKSGRVESASTKSFIEEAPEVKRNEVNVVRGTTMRKDGEAVGQSS